MALVQGALALLARKFKDIKNLSEECLAETVFVRVQPKVVSMLDYRRVGKNGDGFIYLEVLYRD